MKTEIRPENEMKDSGIEWIKHIPRDWNIVPLKRYFQFGKGLPITKADLKETGEKVISYGQIHAKFNTGVLVDDRLIRFVSSDYKLTNASSLCSKGDIILADTSEDKEGCGNAVYIDCDEKIFAGYHTIILKSDRNNKYLAYLFQSDSWREQIQRRVNGVKLFSITKKILNQCTIILPSLSEQQAIADYLDEVCSKIDEIIVEAKASIEEYKELKQAVIFEAVTKGLDRNVEMKDSGYDFIGCIPAKWQMCKVRHLGVLQNGISIGGEAFGNGYPFVSYGDVYKNYSLPKTVDKLVRSSEEDRKRYSVERGDWFFTRTSETIDEIGFSCVCEETILDAVFAGFLIRVRPFNGKIYTGFAKYYFRSKHLRSFFVKEMNLVTRASLAQGLLKDAPVVFPPYNEQVEIANYLENRCEIIDSVIENKESTIADLEAYKKSLIYELVTGKRRVV